MLNRFLPIASPDRLTVLLDEKGEAVVDTTKQKAVHLLACLLRALAPCLSTLAGVQALPRAADVVDGVGSLHGCSHCARPDVPP